MSLIWSVHHALRKRIPRHWIKSIRNIVEARFDFPFRKEHYSQFGEDSVLQSIFAARAWLKSLESGESSRGIESRPGFYVDVGAYSPKEYSNTYWFYKQGWRGINIDATPGSMKVFRSARGRDINVEVAVSDTEGEMTFYTWGTPTVTNTLSAEHAARYAKMIGREPEIVKVRTRTLASILDEHLPPGQEIDFFTIDAEEFTLQVLRSNDWSRYAPSVVIAEVDVEDIGKVLESEVMAFMTERNYVMRAWVGASVIFERGDKAR